MSKQLSLRGFASALLLTATSALAFADAPKVGQPAPTFSATDSNGKTVSLADFKGKIVVLEWTNDGCPFVQHYYTRGNMQALQKEFTAKGVVWLSVISSAAGGQGYADGARANQLTQTRGAAPTAVLLDPKGQLGHRYDAKTTPDMFVIDADGKLVYAGAIDSIASSDPDDIAKAQPYVKVALEATLAGKPVTTALTQSYGCSIKY
ncbi:MAG: thioredoxin family protein [Nevskia sp.]|nr:thioredoxin family protein [Nevskia sp.]